MTRCARMRQTAVFSAALIRLIHGGKQQRQKSHIEIQRQTAELAVALLQRAAQTAVSAAITAKLVFVQRIKIRSNKPKHGFYVRRSKTLPHLRQVTRILPLPRGTRSIDLQAEQRKNT